MESATLCVSTQKTNLKEMSTATVIGSGPNGLSAAIVLVTAGLATVVLERNLRIGGACSTAESTLPGFHMDLGSSVYPMGVASPFFRSLPIAIPWIEPAAPCAHPLDDGTAVMLEHSIEETIATLDGCDAKSYRSLVTPLASDFAKLVEDILRPVQHVPRHPLVLARFGLSAILPALSLARLHFHGKRARALFAGMATHSVLSLDTAGSAAVGLALMAAGHSSGWPIVKGGAQTLSDALAHHLESLGGCIELGREVSELPKSDVTLADLTPRQLLRLVGTELPSRYRRRLERFRYGPGAFKIDYALSAPIPWTARECSRAASVHLGGLMEEIAESERTFESERPFVLLGQPSLFDSSRAPAGKHTAWAYCHVPNGSTKDCTELIERQIVRFAPDFRDCILARKVSSPAELERWNPNLIGGDFLGGAMDLRQLLARPTISLYRTPRANLYLCGASTPPGGGVHGMCGYYAAMAALEARPKWHAK
jgi:phytoene dehydrogenase-like protein